LLLAFFKCFRPSPCFGENYVKRTSARGSDTHPYAVVRFQQKLVDKARYY